MRLLLVEDDNHVAAALSAVLARHGFDVTHARSGEEALQALVPEGNGFGVVLLDLGLPDQDGYEVCGKIRKRTSTPVIMVTARSDVRSRIHGLNLGADDYVVKPFGALELMARITAVLRRAGPGAAAESRAETDGLSLDARERSTLVDGKPVRLQPREFEVLFLLVSHAGKTLSRDFLIQHTTGFGRPVPTRSLDTHIKNLRKKLGPKGGKIVTVPKLGYRLEP
jgi:DNA-binding response OmpR family regulator